jgi:hypothetical protein
MTAELINFKGFVEEQLFILRSTSEFFLIETGENHINDIQNGGGYNQAILRINTLKVAAISALKFRMQRFEGDVCH